MSRDSAVETLAAVWDARAKRLEAEARYWSQNEPAWRLFVKPGYVQAAFVEHSTAIDNRRYWTTGIGAA